MYAEVSTPELSTLEALTREYSLSRSQHKLKLPKEADGTFRLVEVSEWNSFTIQVYGRGKRGWFIVTTTTSYSGFSKTSPPTKLVKGQWRTLLNFVKQAQFWDLPQTVPDPRDYIDGFWMDESPHFDFAGRGKDKYHRIKRKSHLVEKGFARLINYLHKISKEQQAWG